jgi:Carboxypeptidase regulatory-like domain
MGRSHAGGRAFAVAAGLMAVAAVGTLAGSNGSSGTTKVRNPDQPVGSGSAREKGPARIAEGVVGRLVTPAGDRVAGARITARSLDRPAGPVPEIAILSDADGRFAWPLRPGRYRLAAVVAGREIVAATAVVEPGRVTTLELSGAPPAR